MSKIVDLRLRKLEAKQFGRDEEQTRDEIAIAAYECALAILADPASSEADRTLANDVEHEIESEILSQVRSLQDPQHQAWLKRFERGWGGAKWDEYVPAIAGIGNGMNEYADLDKPQIMERRRALWARGAVRNLVSSLTQCSVFDDGRGVVAPIP